MGEKIIKMMRDRINLQGDATPAHILVIEDDPARPMRHPVATVVDVRGPGEAQPDYAADWLREWMSAR